MDIKRDKYCLDFFCYNIKNENKILKIYFAGNLDLYFELWTNEKMEYGEKVSVDFDITKGDYDVFILFDELYNDVINCKITDNYPTDKIFLKENYDKLVDKDKDITWVSDEGQFDYMDSFKLSKVDDDTYRLTFNRNDKNDDFTLKNAYSIPIRISNSGSRYDPFNIIFMRLFNNLQELDPDFRQVCLEEDLYRRRIKL